jgi:hypothetical protein
MTQDEEAAVAMAVDEGKDIACPSAVLQQKQISGRGGWDKNKEKKPDEVCKGARRGNNREISPPQDVRNSVMALFWPVWELYWELYWEMY